MRSLAAIAFSFSTAILLLGLLPAGSWIFWAAGLLAAVGGCVLLLPQLRARRRLRAYLLLILFAASAGLLYGRGWSAVISDPVQEKCGGSRLFSATVCDWPERTDSGGWRVTVRLTEARGAKAVCYVKDEEMGGLEPGQALLGSAYWQDASEISSKELTTFTSRGVFALLYCEEMPSAGAGRLAAVSAPAAGKGVSGEDSAGVE